MFLHKTIMSQMSLYIVCLVSGDQLRSPAVSRTLNLDNMLSISHFQWRSFGRNIQSPGRQELVAYSLINDDLQISKKKNFIFAQKSAQNHKFCNLLVKCPNARSFAHDHFLSLFLCQHLGIYLVELSQLSSF